MKLQCFQTCTSRTVRLKISIHTFSTPINYHTGLLNVKKLAKKNSGCMIPLLLPLAAFAAGKAYLMRTIRLIQEGKQPTR